MVALAEPNSTLTPDAISDQILNALPFGRPERSTTTRSPPGCTPSCSRPWPASKAK
jgi:hypothetical protein